MNVELEKNRKPRGSREFVSRGAAVWIPVALFVLLVLFQMVPLPAGVLKVVSPATYELYEEMLPEDGGRLATDPHQTPLCELRTAGRLKETEVRCQKSEDGGQRSEDRGRRTEIRGQKSEVRRARAKD